MGSATATAMADSGGDGDEPTTDDDKDFFFFLLRSMFGVMGLAVGLVVFCFIAAVEGFVIRQMWVWFIVPMFGVRDITIAGGFALANVVAAFRLTTNKPNNKPSFAFFFTSAAIILGIGYVVHLLVVYGYITLAR
jgi:hypothetical protein